VTEVILIHFMATPGNDGEYIALIEAGDDDDYGDPRYEEVGRFTVEARDGNSVESMLPTGRTFKEW
jgi:hypothetical protein